MKKIRVILTCVFISGVSAGAAKDGDEKQDYRLSTALTAGFVFKHDDCIFKQVYGRGIVNVITADNCYYFWKPLGVGAKISYWRAHGCTTFLRQCSFLQEIPLTFYLRALADLDCGLQLYASLGGGVIWIREKSYLGCVRLHKGIGEVEAGLHYPLAGCFNVTGAFRYLFPRQTLCGQKTDVGGFDVRAGIAFVY